MSRNLEHQRINIPKPDAGFVQNKEGRRTQGGYVSNAPNVQVYAQTYHQRQGFEILSAARRLQSDSAPEQPRSPEGQAHQYAVIEDVPPVIEEQLLSAEAWQRRLEHEHTLATKPPTKRKKAPKLACLECRYKNGTRVDRRTICSSCETGFAAMHA